MEPKKTSEFSIDSLLKKSEYPVGCTRSVSPFSSDSSPDSSPIHCHVYPPLEYGCLSPGRVPYFNNYGQNSSTLHTCETQDKLGIHRNYFSGIKQSDTITDYGTLAGNISPWSGRIYSEFPSYIEQNPLWMLQHRNILSFRSSDLTLPSRLSDAETGIFLSHVRKPKRVRTAFSPSQLLQLEHAFENNHYVVGQERKELATGLGLSETQVKVWFQNRRTKYKRVRAEEEMTRNLVIKLERRKQTTKKQSQHPTSGHSKKDSSEMEIDSDADSSSDVEI